MTVEKKRRGLTGWEKTAIVVIVILIITILALVFRDQLEDYFRVFMDWYGNEA
jgi:hypothetical protein